MYIHVDKTKFQILLRKLNTGISLVKIKFGWSDNFNICCYWK